MTTSESKDRFFYKTNRFESIGITNRIESIRIANWNALTSRPRRHCQCSDRRNSRGDLCDVEVNLATWWHLCMYKVRYLCISLQTCNVSSSSENAKIRLDGGPGNIQTSSFFYPSTNFREKWRCTYCARSLTSFLHIIVNETGFNWHITLDCKYDFSNF